MVAFFSLFFFLQHHNHSEAAPRSHSDKNWHKYKRQNHQRASRICCISNVSVMLADSKQRRQLNLHQPPLYAHTHARTRNTPHTQGNNLVLWAAPQSRKLVPEKVISDLLVL